MRYLVIYDITDERRMRRVAGKLSAYGIRVQKSAFECELTETDSLRLFRELKKAAGAGDSIAGYRFSAKYGIKSVAAEPETSGGNASKRQNSRFIALRG